MNNYEAPEFEIVEIEGVDVITASGDTDTDPTQL